MGPDIQYTDEKKVEELVIRISKFEEDGRTKFDIHVSDLDEVVTVDYTAKDGKHTITVSETEIDIQFI